MHADMQAQCAPTLEARHDLPWTREHTLATTPALSSTLFAAATKIAILLDKPFTFVSTPVCNTSMIWLLQPVIEGVGDWCGSTNEQKFYLACIQLG